MSIKNTEAAEVVGAADAAEQPVVNKQAWSEVTHFVKEQIEATPENKPKTRRNYETILNGLREVRVVINDKVGKIRACKEQIAELQAANQALEQAAENEPIANSFAISRHVSFYTDTADRIKNGLEPVTDMYHCYAPVSDIISRIKPIIDPEDGVLGIKVVVNECFGHVIMFHELIGLLELRERRTFDVQNKPADAAEVYVEGITLAVSIADTYAKAFGGYAAIPVVTRNNNEDENIPDDAKVASDIEVESEEDTESGEDGIAEDEDADEDDAGLDGEENDAGPDDVAAAVAGEGDEEEPVDEDEE